MKEVQTYTAETLKERHAVLSEYLHLATAVPPGS